LVDGLAAHRDRTSRRAIDWDSIEHRRLEREHRLAALQDPLIAVDEPAENFPLGIFKRRAHCTLGERIATDVRFHPVAADTGSGNFSLYLSDMPGNDALRTLDDDGVELVISFP
jgi:hypothetical protein